MFVEMVDPDLARLIADAPDWPMPDELWTVAPPVAPPDEDGWDIDELSPVLPVETDPSGWFALELDAASANPRALSDAQLVDAMTGFGRVGSWAQARQARLVAEFDRRRPGSASRYAPDEVSLALSMSRFGAVGLLSRSRRLVDTLHATLAAHETGHVDGFKVRVICDAVRHLDDAQAEWVQDLVLDQAPCQSVAQLRAALERAVIAADPEGANTRHRNARKERRVGIGQEQDGMATMWASVSAQDAQQMFGTLTGLARSLGANDPRGMDARRADLLVGLTTGEISIAFPAPTATAATTTSQRTTATDDDQAATDDDQAATADHPADADADADAGADNGARPASDDDRAEPCPVCAAQAWRASRPRLRPVNPAKPLVQILIGHSTLRGADHAPADLVGHGAICADQAREIAADAVWRRLVYDDESGAVLDHGRRTYRPPAALADHVRARDVHCRSPLCRRRALDCELDHTVAFPHGPTAEPNLTSGCVLHHGEKHSPGWTVVQHPDGRVDWTTPTGHVHSSEVHDYRPLPPPPPLTIPGPIADRTDARPAPPGRRARHHYDWTGPADQTDDPPPF